MARHAVAALILLVGGAESWAPKRNAPIHFRRGGAPTPEPVRDAPDIDIAAAGAATSMGRVLQTEAGRKAHQRRLQTYDAEYEHPDSQDARGMEMYPFDQPTGQGSRWATFGYDPVSPTWRDLNLPPTDAEMYPLLLNADEQTQYDLLHREWLRKEEKRRTTIGEGTFDANWCFLSGIGNGMSDCNCNQNADFFWIFY